MVATKEQRDARKKKTAEIFTPPKLVNEMLDKLPDEIWEPGKTFCDPACGNGNILIEVLKRKLQHKQNPTVALESIYGVDIMGDNIEECRERLLGVIKETTETTKITAKMRKIVNRNIKWLDQKKYPKGALDYDFEFTPD